MRQRIAPDPLGSPRGAPSAGPAGASLGATAHREGLRVEGPLVGAVQSPARAGAATLLLGERGPVIERAGQPSSDFLYFEVRDHAGLRRVKVAVENAQAYLDTNWASIVGYAPFLRAPVRFNG